jgi:hypothetical protein
MVLFSDPGAGDSASAKGMISLSFGKLFEKVRLFSTQHKYTSNHLYRVSHLVLANAMLKLTTANCET